MIDIVEAVSAEFASEPVVNEPAPIEPVETTEKVETPEPEKVEEPFEGSKKEENAIARLKKQRNSLQYDKKVLQEKLAQYEKAKQAPAPKQEDYQEWETFQDAKTDHKIELKTAEREAEQAKARVENADNEWTQERQAVANARGAALEKEHPAISKLVQDNFHIISAYPPEIKKALLEADDAPLALANLAIEGRLEDLGTMTLARAAMEIGKAESKPILKKTTNAPAPLSPLRESVSTGPNVNNLSPDDLLKLIRKG